MRQEELVQEVNDIVERAIAEGRTAPLSWLVQEVVDQHPMVEWEQADWFRHCAYGHVHDTVRQVVRRFKPSKDEISPQLAFPGWPRLQRAYLIERNGEQQIVATQDMSSHELDLKADELERMSVGCMQHARDLRRYRRQRFGDEQAIEAGVS